MTEIDASVGDFAAIIRKPSDFLPIFLLIFKEHSLVFKVFSYLDNNITRLVDLTSDVEGGESICNVSNSILLSLALFNWQLSIFIIFLNG
jgi:hypothetical protein